MIQAVTFLGWWVHVTLEKGVKSDLQRLGIKRSLWITWGWMRRSCSLGEICWFDFCVFFCETRSALLKECVNKFYMLQGKKTEIWNPNFILCEFWRRKKHSCSVNITFWACFKIGALKNPLVSKVNWSTYFQQTLLLFWRFPKIPFVKDINIWTKYPDTVPKCPKTKVWMLNILWECELGTRVIDRIIFFCGVHRVAKSTSFWGVSFVEIDPPLF